MTPKKTIGRERLERELAAVRDELAELDDKAAPLRRQRDRIVKRLRALDDPPSLRRVAELAGLSNPRVSAIEHDGR